jgi:hypothetical protein
MPITFACPSCGKTLRVGDAHAGKSIRCPQCQAISTAPDDAPDDIPVVEAVVKPPPPPPAPPPPPPPPPKFGNAPKAKPKPKPEPEVLDDEEDDEPRRKPKRGEKGRKSVRDRERDTFASGCNFVRLGIWIDFAAIFGGLLMLLAVGLIVNSSPTTGSPKTWVRPILMVLGAGVLVALATASIFTAIGRFQMGRPVTDSGVTPLLMTVGILGMLRGALVVVGAIVTLLEILGADLGVPLFTMFLFIGLGLGWLLDFAVLPALGAVGGVTGNLPLRRSVGTLGLFFLLTLLAYPFVVFGIAAMGFDPVSTFDLRSPFAPGTGTGRVPTTSSTSARPPTVIFILFGLFLLAVYIAYTFLHQAVYKAGRTSSVRSGSADDYDF